MISDQLINGIRKRDDAAFKQAYEKSIHYVYAIVRRYVNNDSDHADVIQEIYARVFLSIKSYDSKKGQFKYWLGRIAINLCLEHYRKQRPDTHIVPLEGVHVEDTTLEKRLSELTADEVEDYIANMPDGYKQIFMLVILDEFSHKEVSELMGISVQTSRSQLSRAKSWLKKNLNTGSGHSRLAIGL